LVVRRILHRLGFVPSPSLTYLGVQFGFGRARRLAALRGRYYFTLDCRDRCDWMGNHAGGERLHLEALRLYAEIRRLEQKP
jgi:hypothetical protein